MEFTKKNIKTILGIITFAIVIFTISQNLSVVTLVWTKLLKILAPVIVGFCLAFILNIPMTIIETKILAPMKKSNKNIVTKLVRPLSLILTVLLTLGFIILLIFIIFPQLKDSIVLIIEKIPQYYKLYLLNYLVLIEQLHMVF